MFDSMKIERSLSKGAFKEMEPRIREGLLDLQSELIAQKRRSILILVNGPDGAGKGGVLNQLYGWLDPRKLRTLTYDEPTEEERLRPIAWRFWRDMPAAGEIGIVLGSWYHAVLEDFVRDGGDLARFNENLQSINRHEQMLTAEGVVILKLWLYLEPQVAEARLKALRKGPMRRPVVLEWHRIVARKHRRRLQELATEAFRITSTLHAPWMVIPAEDRHYRDAMVGSVLMETLGRAVAPDTPPDPPSVSIQVHTPELPQASVLSTLDLSKSLTQADYHTQIKHEQARITTLASSRAFARRGLVCVFEGSDAAGKSSTIMRLREALDPRRFRVVPISAPTDEERARPYLWRFWRSIPAHGHTTIFDRSWYGRVLVERVEGFTPPVVWGRAYGEINDFEHQLHAAGYVVAKFWLAISPEEQARRFQERETIAYKRYKLTPEDWRNRAKWPLYERAVTDMVDRTSTFFAPWTLVEAEDKLWSRVKVLRTIADRLDEALG